MRHSFSWPARFPPGSPSGPPGEVHLSPAPFFSGEFPTLQPPLTNSAWLRRTLLGGILHPAVRYGVGRGKEAGGPRVSAGTNGKHDMSLHDDEFCQGAGHVTDPTHHPPNLAAQMRCAWVGTFQEQGGALPWVTGERKTPGAPWRGSPDCSWNYPGTLTNSSRGSV
jgi:hypothetical protein